MEIKKQFVQMSDGHQIATTLYIPPSTPKKHIHLLHGMAEHQKRYIAFATLLAEQGYLVSSHDHRGHGDTAEQNGKNYGYFAHENGFERVVEDVQEVVQNIREQIGNYPLVLFGHSMGSFIARRYTQLYSEELAAVIYCGTGATTPLHIAGNTVAKILARIKGGTAQSPLMNDLSFGSFNKGVVNAATNFDWLCTDKEQVQKYIDDPQCGFIATNQFFVDLTDGLIKISNKRNLKKIRKNLPILFIAGAEDPVGDMGKGIYKVAAQFEQAGIRDVTVYMFEGMRHEILNEGNKQHVYDVVTRWIENGKV